MVEFLVIGPLEARGPAGVVALGGGKQRLLLAVLVLRAGEIVSQRAIIDALWPEQPPPSAAHTVESYVSRLRAALRAAGVEEKIIASTPGGYRLSRDGNSFDCDAFNELARRASETLDHGEAQAASDLASDALGLWRGPALAGMAEEPGVRADAAALEERRLQVLETRAEAELALGHHAELIPELRGEAASQPARERVHELLMLALYRAGRQADALEVYRVFRTHLSDDLGLEPSPALRARQTQILSHDPSLDTPRRARVAGRETPAATVARRPSRLVRVGLSVALVAVVAAAVLVLTAGGGTGSAAVARLLRTPALGVFDLADGQPRAAIALSAVPSAITAGLGAEWATSYDNGTLLRIDPSESAVVQTVQVGHGPTGVAVAAGDVWVADTLDDQLTRVNAATDNVVQQIPVGADPGAVAAGAGAIWVANAGDGTVSRVDPLTGAVLGATTVGASPAGVAVGDGAVWVALSGTNSVARIDPQTGHPLQTISVGSGPSAIAVGRAGVWVANELDSTVSLIDPSSDTVVLTLPVTGSPTSLAADGADVWSAGDAPELTVLSPSGHTQEIAIPSPATALATGPEGVLVGVRGISADHRGGTLVVRMAGGGPIDQIDPASCCDLPPDVRPLAYDSLLSFSKSPASPDTLVPDLAIAIPAPQDGGRSYTFRLRPGIRYSTGAPVRASDFVRGLEDAAQSSDVDAAYIDALPGAEACPGARSCNLARAVTADDRAGTVTMHLTHPDPDILLALGLPYFAPKPPGGGIRPATGPYRIARYVPGDLIDYERNPFFHEWSPAAQPAGYPDRILVYSNGTATADIDAVLGGRADYTFDTPSPSQLRTIQLQYPGLLHTEPLPDTDWLSMDTREAPFDDVRVRQALNDAVDRDAIANLYGGPEDATPTCQIIPATIPGHQPYCPYTRDPTASGRWTAPDLPRARRLIAASGTRGDTVTVLTESQSGPGSEPVGAYMVTLLRRLGYHARLHVVTAARYSAAINDYRHPAQIATEGWIADYPSAAQWITIHLSCAAWRPPTQLSNRSQICDPRVDRLAARAAELQTNDPSDADHLWAQADRLITNLAPWLSTVTETETDLVSQRVGNYQYVPTIGALLDQLWVR